MRDAPRDPKVPLRSVTIFPAGGVRNAKTRGTVLRREDVEEKAIGALLLKRYSLDEDVPGTWTFQVWFGDHMLAAKSFTLTKQ